MGDRRPVELDLEFGTVVGDEGPGRAYDETLDDYDEHFDEYADGFDGAGMEEDGHGGVKEEDEEDTDDEPWPQDPEVVHKKEEEAETDDEGTCTKPPAKLFQPSSLLRLTTRVVASNLEKYPPGSIGVLSEYHWDGVVKARVDMKRDGPKEPPVGDLHVTPAGWEVGAKTLIAFDGNSSKKRLPALSEKFLLPIEKHPRNAHLSCSRTADELFWRDVVDYRFGGMNRPRSLEVPCDLLEERLRGWGEGLLEVVAPPKSRGEYAAEMSGKDQATTLKEGCHGVKVEAGHKRGREDDLFGEESDDDVKEEAIHDNGASEVEYRQYLEVQSNERTNTLRRILHSLRQSPMDVTLLAETEVGKSAAKAIKALKKLKKSVKNKGEREAEEEMLGYPRFWKPVSWGEEQQQRMKGDGSGEEALVSPLDFLQKILQDWKDMASEDGVEMSSSRPPTKNRKVDNATTTCGKDKRMSSGQHQVDMKLLHASPDWRSLYQSLKRREGLTRKAHGDKVRSIRENLEKDRPKVGKVTLKKAVGRVRGSGGTGIVGTGGKVMMKQPMGTGGPSLIGQAGSLSRRKELILSKSLGHRARQQQLSQNPAASHSSGKLRQLRGESKVAASWSKSSHKEASGVRPSSFGASVARAGGVTSGRARKPQAGVQVQLKGGKRMGLPSSQAGGAAKSVGVFSSLERKKRMKQIAPAQQGKPQQRWRPKNSSAGGAGTSLGTSTKMKKLKRQVASGKYRTGGDGNRKR